MNDYNNRTGDYYYRDRGHSGGLVLARAQGNLVLLAGPIMKGYAIRYLVS